MESFLMFLLPIGATAGGLLALQHRRNLQRSTTGRYAGDLTELQVRPGGYDAASASEFWGKLQESGDLAAERAFLKDDLAFPLLYGGATVWSLIYAISVSGWPATAYLLVLPVLATMVMDWSENSLQLGQLDRVAHGHTPESRPVRLASLATQAKLVLGGLSVAAFLAAWVAFALR